MLSGTGISDAVSIESKPLVHAIQNIMNRFYMKHTTIIYITEQTTLATRNGLKPRDLASEIIRFVSEQAAMSYVIDDNVTLADRNFNRLFNVFVIDSYESFRYVAIKKEFDRRIFY